MTSTIIYSVAGVLGLLVLVFVARLAIRWAMRLALIGFLLLIVLGGVTWWWFSQPTSQPESKPRPAPTRRASSDRR